MLNKQDVDQAMTDLSQPRFTSRVVVCKVLDNTGIYLHVYSMEVFEQLNEEGLAEAVERWHLDVTERHGKFIGFSTSAGIVMS